MSENGCLKDGIFHNLQVTGHLFQNNATTPRTKVPGADEVNSHKPVKTGVTTTLDLNEGNHDAGNLHDKTPQEIVTGLNYYTFDNSYTGEYAPLFVYNQAQAQNIDTIKLSVSGTGINLPAHPTSYVLYDKLYIQQEKITSSMSKGINWRNYYLQANQSSTFNVSYTFTIDDISNLDTLTFGLRRVTGYETDEAPEDTEYIYPDFPGDYVSGYKDYYGIQIQPNSSSLLTANPHADLYIIYNDDDDEGSTSIPFNAAYFNAGNPDDTRWRIEIFFTTTGQVGEIVKVNNILITNTTTHERHEIFNIMLAQPPKQNIVLNNVDLNYVYFSPFIWYKPAEIQGSPVTYSDPDTNVILGIDKKLNTQNGLDLLGSIFS